MKSKYLRSILFFLFFTSGFMARGQQQVYDSLMTIIHKNTNDSIHCKALLELSWKMMQQNPDSSFLLASKALHTATVIKNDFWIAKSFNLIAITQTMTGKLDLAKANYDSCLIIRTRMNDTLGVAAVLNNIGNVYRYKGWYDMAVEYFLRSIKIEEAHGDSQRISEGYTNLGSVYGELPDPKNALLYFYKSKALIKDSANASLAGIYANIGTALASLQENDSSIYYNEAALVLATKYNDIYNKSIAYTGLGYAYSNKAMYDKAITYHRLAYEISKELGDINGMAQCLMSLGDIYQKTGRHEEVIKAATHSAELAKEAESLQLMKKNYALLSEAYKQTGNYEKAYYYHDLYSQASDSLLNDAKQKSMEEMRVRFETEKKDKENILLQRQNEIKDITITKQNTLMVVLASLLSLLGVIGYLFYYRNKVRQKEILEREKLTQLELRSKAVFDAEEKERLRLGQELHDGVGQLLSTAKLSLENLKSKINLPDDEHKIALQNSLDLIDESTTEVRSLSHSMLPNVLIKSGLAKAIREFIDKVAATGKLKVELQVTGLDQRLNETTESFLYRIMQELIHNIIKHAEASSISIQLIRHVHNITLMVEDDGKGFDYRAVTQKDGVGIANIESRVAFLNGTVTFDSTPQYGTTAIVEIPI